MVESQGPQRKAASWRQKRSAAADLQESQGLAPSPHVVSKPLMVCCCSIGIASKEGGRGERGGRKRVFMCEVCEQSPAAVTCKADAAALCSSCDRDIHSANPLARRHERLPVVPFFHTPSDHLSRSSPVPIAPPTSVDAVEDDSWLIPNLQGNLACADYMCASDDLDSFMDSGSPDFDFKKQVNEPVPCHRSYDSVVPNQTKTRHLNLNSLFNENCFEIDFTQSKLNFSSQSVSSSDVGIVPDGNSNSISEVPDFQLAMPTTANRGGGGALDGGSAPVQLSRIDRVARVMRYREKRKNRKFEKTIRYASRKAYAETRPRIKGRFAKRTDNAAEVDQIYADSGVNGVVGGFFIEEDMYGVVPSF